MRTKFFPILVAFASTIAMPAMAQQQTGTQQQTGPKQNMQNEADKGVKTHNSGDSGYVADQDKPGASAHPPGQPDKTTGSNSATTPGGR
jgi:hypothetical protein